MRILIDGYNLMFAGGLLGKRLGPDGFRKVRHRFLNDLADLLGPLDASGTTVVFDASQAPDGFPSEAPHKGLSVIYAVGDDDADSRIEHLIAQHSHPKGLTVVSSDRRIRQAALRRKAHAVTAHDYWTELDARRGRRRVRPHTEVPTPSPTRDRPDAGRLSQEERDHWLRTFGDLDDQAETREALNPSAPLLSDEEIARIEREVEAEDP